MKVRNKRPRPLEIATRDFTASCAALGDVEVPDEVGESLVEQVDVWEKVKPPKAAKADKENS